LDGELVAMKLYKDAQERTFKNTTTYLTGKFYKKTSHEKAITKGNAFSKKLIYDNWVYREFSLLEKLYSLGIKIPKPILHIENAIFMEYLGE
jgi:RIO kinase 1